MLICVSSEVLGTKKHLVYQDGAYSWSNTLPAGAWVYGIPGTLKSLDALFDFFNFEKPSIQSQPHLRSFKAIIQDGLTEIPWHAVLPPEEFQKSLVKLISSLENVLRCFSDNEYNGIFIDEREFLLSLSRAFVDGPLLASYIRDEQNQTVRSTLTTFRPLADLKAGPVMYNQSATLTGRLTIQSGPQVLTLPKKYRDIMISRYEKGKMMQVDFVSLEPRVARLAAGHKSDHDVYIQLSNELFESSLTREQAKIAVLCALYGVSKNRLSKMLGPEFNASIVIDKIKKFFGVPELLRSVMPELTVNAKFQNYFGRYIEPDRTDAGAMVNYYIQSSAADVALLGFINLKEKIDKFKLRCIPTFVIHDAMVLDVHPDDEESLIEILAGGVDISTLGNFPATLSVISGPGE